MSAETARKGIDLALRRSGKRAHVVFFGGEPALRLGLVSEAATYARAEARRIGKTVTFEISTNGTLIGEDFLALVRRFGLLVAVSLDGPKEVHDVHRKAADGRGSFDLIDGNLDPLFRVAPWTIASSVATPETVGSLSNSARFLFDRGFRIVMTSLDHSAKWGPRDLRRLKRELGHMAALYERLTRQGRKFYLSCMDGAIRSHVRGASSASTECGAGVDHLSVAPSGKLFPCVQFVNHPEGERWALGDVDGGLSEQRAHRVVPGLAVSNSACSGCALSPRCASGCPCANLAASGDPGKVSPLQCASQRLAIPSADRVAARLYKKRDRHFIHKQYNRLYPAALCIEDALLEKEVKDAANR